MVLPVVILMCSTMSPPSLAPVVGGESETVAMLKTCTYVVECWRTAGDEPRRTFHIRASSEQEAIRSAKAQYSKMMDVGASVIDKRDCD